MFKVVCLLKRKAGMTLEEFIDYYETTHVKLGLKGHPNARRYCRRFLRPFPNPVSGLAEEPEFDVITEIWFDNRHEFDLAMKNLATPDIAAAIKADEERLFERDRIRLCTVEEHESDMEHAR